MPTDPLAPALQWSGHLRRRLDARPDLRHWLHEAAAHALDEQALQRWFAELAGAPAAGHRLPVAQCRAVLRKLRERVFCCAMARDMAGLAPLEEVVGAMTALADLAVAQAYRSVATELAAVHGVPRDAHGAPQEMLILGMGKLGGRELNVSSDIDLIMLYGEEGETDGRRRLSHHEFYGRLTQRMMPVISEADADGQVFRTDLRLRPDGDAGPLAWSLDALELYLVAQGREWERYAWLKARPMPAHAFEGSQPEPQLRQLESLRVPFVYRKYLDFDALAALRGLRERIRLDWQRRALARNGVDTVHNIKLGEGGIREIEFVVQLSQLIRGGRTPALQTRGLIEALRVQAQAGLLPAQDAARLEAAYRFLRRTEHMLQYREDEQTHLLPSDPERRAALAQAMGMAPQDFEQTLAQHREFVAHTFHDAFRLAGLGGGTHGAGGAGGEPAGGADESDSESRLASRIHARFGEQAEPLLARAEALLSSHRVRSLPETSRRRVETLLPAAIDAASQTAEPLAAATRLLDLIEQIAQRSAYLALLAEYPDTLARVARIVAASPWAAQYLTKHPLLLDGLIDWRTLFEPLDFPQVSQQLRRDLDACRLPDGQPDIERQMNLMRDVQRQASFQLLAQDLEGELSVEKLADQLSALADLLLEETLRRCWPLVAKDPQAGAPRFAVIAYGKLGGKELGYVSDLDLVFLFEDPAEDAPERYAKLGRRMSSWLSTLTSSGRLYEVDLRLRPDGEAGLLAVSVEAFAQYQRGHAWLWEHQALTRARYAAGDPQVGARFEQIRREILLTPRENDTLAGEVLAMRERIRAGHPNTGPDFDLKHDRGGMVDVEFVTQYLVLRHAPQHPELADNLGNIALLKLAAAAGLVGQDLALQAGDAYRTLRRRQHALRLKGLEKARVPGSELQAERKAVQALWDAVLGQATPASPASLGTGRGVMKV
ncbi:bifunctional [glutamate--ammonia ligase]-adenylyl-L-tyrosine phosphorylase/[glutamate--ammonia-ligase] adenylyltransferase [Orrella sp. JC864]|uniref:bifunctional [glutamate--ammonia ligase]-adenylyl-L-tyrosine phosphorylase/[glutamate--ammonia-ligase] adenylyltransferase n=1 Tax=Orrella sp. JC864 TaxID=3120298 RepID=UPI0030086EC6